MQKFILAFSSESTVDGKSFNLGIDFFVIFLRLFFQWIFIISKVVFVFETVDFQVLIKQNNDH